MKAGSEPTKRERDAAHAEECCKLANDRFHLHEQVRHLQDAAAKYELRIKELEEALRYADRSYNDGAWIDWTPIVKALSTTSHDKALQRVVLEARIDEAELFPTSAAGVMHIKQLRDELAALKGE